jgi:hypothetical protein
VVSADTGNAVYPTLARHRVLDSRGAGLEDLDRVAPYTPIIAVYTVEAGRKLRGPMTDAGDMEADASIEIVAELAHHDSEGDEEFAGVLAKDDPSARLVLEALVSQCDYALDLSAAGGLFRRLRAQLIEQESVVYAVPQLGLRFHRITTRRHYQIRSDDFDVAAGELPEPMRSLHAALPDGSYAKDKLTELAAYFNPDVYPPLEGVAVTAGTLSFGLPSED